MKKLLVVVAVAAITLVAGVAMATVVATSHDLSGGGANQVCVYCHTPHAANVTLTGIPLWNRSDAGAIVTGTYGGVTSAIDPRGSTICLSCHDGVLNDATLLNGPGKDNAGAAGGTLAQNPDLLSIIATDAATLSNDHPIGGNAPIANVPSNTLTLPTYDGAGAVVANGNVECATCHDVHDAINAGTLFLRASNAASALCVSCHSNK